MTTLPTNDRAATRESLTESKPASGPTPGAPNPTERIFLTPRVLDAAAFTEYAEALQGLIRDLEDRSARLAGASTDSDRVAGTLREATAQLKQRAQAGAALVKRLETQITSAERALGTLKTGFGDEQTIAQLAEEALVNRQSVIDRAIAQRFAALETRLRDAEERADQAEARAAAATEQLTTLERSLGALTAQAETIETRTTESLREAESRADRSTTKTLEALEQLRVLADDIRSKAGADTSSIESRLGPVRDLLANASTMLGSPDEPGTLQQAIDRARDHANRLDTVNAATDQNITAAAEAQATIVDTVNAAAESLESLQIRRTQLVDALEQDIESLREEVSPIERAAASLGATITELAERTSTLHQQIRAAGETIRDAEHTDPAELASASISGEVDASLAKARAAADDITSGALKQVEEAAAWLAALAAQSNPPQPVPPAGA